MWPVTTFIAAERLWCSHDRNLHNFHSIFWATSFLMAIEKKLLGLPISSSRSFSCLRAPESCLVLHVSWVKNCLSKIRGWGLVCFLMGSWDSEAAQKHTVCIYYCIDSAAIWSGGQPFLLFHYLSVKYLMRIIQIRRAEQSLYLGRILENFLPAMTLSYFLLIVKSWSYMSPLPSLMLFYDFMEIGINLELKEYHSFSSMSFRIWTTLCCWTPLRSPSAPSVSGYVPFLSSSFFFEDDFLRASGEFTVPLPFLCLPVLNPIQNFFMALWLSLLRPFFHCSLQGF